MIAKDIKILGLAISENNENIIKYVIPYYQRIGIDKLIILDNYSSDNTVNELSKYDFIEVIAKDYKISEEEILEFKNSWVNYKEEYDWCINCDFNEVVFANGNFREMLYEKNCEGKTYLNKMAFNLLNDSIEEDSNRKLIHEVIEEGILSTNENFGLAGFYKNKVYMFNMKKVNIEYNSYYDGNFIASEFAASFNDSFFIFKIENANRSVYDIHNKIIPVSSYLNCNINSLIPKQYILLLYVNGNEDAKEKIDFIGKNIMNLDKNRQIALLIYSENDLSEEELFYYSLNYRIKMSAMPNTPSSEIYKNIYRFNYLFNNNVSFKNPRILLIDNYNKLNSLINDFSLISEIRNDCETAFVGGIHCAKFDYLVNSELGKEKSTLGAYMIVKNEEKNIKRCVDELINFCDEIVIADTGSDDRTIEILNSYLDPRIKIFNFKWTGNYSEARNFALSKITSDYCFTTDADEIFSEELQDYIIKAKWDNFNDKTCIELFLLNYNGLDTIENNYYLGGRTITKTSPNLVWKYPIHEKLYYDESRMQYVYKNNGVILHKKEGGAINDYSKYSKIYFNELNKSGEGIENENLSHFFYYMNFTMMELDKDLCQYYLLNCFYDKNVKSTSEIYRYILNERGWINDEQLDAYIKISRTVNEYYIVLNELYTNNDPIAKYAISRYILLHRDTIEFQDSLEYAMYIIISSLIKFGSLRKSHYFSDIARSENFSEEIFETIFESDALYFELNKYKVVLKSNDEDLISNSIAIYYLSKYFDNITFVTDKKDEFLNKLNIDNFETVNFLNYDSYIDKEDDEKLIVIESNTNYERYALKNALYRLAKEGELNYNGMALYK